MFQRRQAPTSFINTLLDHCYNQTYPTGAIESAMPLRHNEYYMQDGDVIFLVRPEGSLFASECSHTDIFKVEDTLFKIHKRLLTRSKASIFTTMFESSQIKGETDETPFELQGDSVEDFEGLMRVLYPP